METKLVRLKPYDPRRGHVLRRYTYRGIKFHEERGWYRVEGPVGEYLRAVHQVPSDEHSQLAFDVCTDDEARRLDSREKDAGVARKAATDDINVSPARPMIPAPTEAPAESGEERTNDRKSRGR